MALIQVPVWKRGFRDKMMQVSHAPWKTERLENENVDFQTWKSPGKRKKVLEILKRYVSN